MEGLPSFIPTSVWLALFPLSYLIHFAEEYWGGEGYPAYLFRLRGVHISATRFVVLHAVGFTSIIVLGVIATILRFPEFVIAIFGALVLSNGISHAVTAWRNGGYGPGLISSTLLWIPLGAITLVSMLGRMSTGRLAIAALIGITINGMVALLTLRGWNMAVRQPN